jgi:integrase
MTNKKESRSRTLEVLADRVFRRSRSKGSAETYIWGVRRFCEFTGEDPDGLIRKLANGKLALEKLLNSWLDRLDKEGVSPRTQKLYFYSVKKFADVNLPDEPFNWKKVELPRSWGVEEDRVPTKDELGILMDHGNLLDRVVIAVMSSSGIRENTLVNLTLGDLDLESYQDMGVVRVRPEAAKERVTYLTFVSLEAKVLLKRYLDLRFRKGEPMKPEIPLIAKYEVKRSDKKAAKKLTEEGWWISGEADGSVILKKAIRISEAALRSRWRRLLKSANLAEKKRKFHSLRLHTLRKYFRTRLEAANVPTGFIEIMMGHKPYLDQSYLKPSEEELAEKYRLALPELAISEVVQQHTSWPHPRVA